MVRKELVFAKESLKSRDEVFNFIADAADKAGLLNDKKEYIAALYRREEEISTSIGHGIAIPHGKTDAVKEAFIAFVSVDKTFVWDESTGDEIEGIFMIGVPASGTETLHLKAIAAISKKLINDEFRAKLFGCKTGDEAYSLLHEIDEGIK